MLKKIVSLISFGCILSSLSVATETQEKNMGSPQQRLARPATNEDMAEFVDCLKRNGVLKTYLDYGDDPSKIPQEETVYLFRLEDAFIAFNNAMSQKYDRGAK